MPLRGYSHDVLGGWNEFANGKAIDFIFIDGSHQYLDVLKDFELSFPLVKNGGWIAFHDVVHTWPGPESVWHYIAKFRLVNHQYSSTLACGQKLLNFIPFTLTPELPIHFLTDATLLPLNLKDINLIIFPDWSQPEESLCLDLQRVIGAIATHPDSSQITLLVVIGNISDEDAALILASVTMNLLLQEDVDVTDGPEISLVGQLGEIQWEALLPRIHARIVLENENQGAMPTPTAWTSSYAWTLDTFVQRPKW